MALRRVLAVAAASAFVLAACQPAAPVTPTPDPATPAPAPATPTPDVATPTPAPATPEPTPEALACTPQDPNLQNAGRLTIATDNPAFPPYFDFPAEGEEPASPVNQTEPWALGDPTNKRGFEAAVAWEIADRMGFADEQVDWMFVDWTSLWAPGPKEFDFGLAQISFTEERAQQVGMSEGYYFVNQALIAPIGHPLTEAATMDDIRQYTIGAQVGTTSLAYVENVIQPAEVRSYTTNADAILALLGDLDGLVVDLPTAFFMTAVQLEELGVGGELVAVFPSVGEQEYFTIVAEQDSPFLDCVNQAIVEMRDDGTLEAITDEWLTGPADAPVIEP
jgi:polar amino acid transport system substrate-binding protein